LGNGFARKILFVAILCALSGTLAAEQTVRAYAQGQATVTITAKAGLHGFCREDKWLPVHVTVENKGADIDARVQASYKNSADGQTSNEMQVSLPATSRKEFFLYLTAESFMRDFSVSVLDGNKVLAKANLNVSCENPPITLLGLIADTPSNFTMLNNVQPMTGRVQTPQLEISDLPDLAQGWEMLDALIISNVDTGKLTPAQKQALELWLADGGRLFVTGGTQWQPTAAGLGDLLPLQPKSTTKVADLSSLSSYAITPDNQLEAEATLATGKLQPNVKVLVEQDNVPVLVEKAIGFGKVYYFAADPGLRPLNGWDGMRKIYEHLLAFESPKPAWANNAWDNNQANSALSALPELSLPSIAYICCWLGVYIVIIGPVNYFVLRRMKRPELAWITVPILVVIFTCMAYFSGYAYRGTKPILNRIMLLQGWEGQETAKAAALVGVYSPTRTTYDVESREQFLLYPFPSINENLQGNNKWQSVKTDSGVVIPAVRVEIGGVQSLGATGSLSPKISIQNDLTYVISDKTPKLTGSITNTSGHELSDVVVITPSGWKVLGKLSPGESAKINITLDATDNSDKTRYKLISALGWSVLPNTTVEERRRSAFLNAVTQSDNDVLTVNSGVYLMAWLDKGVNTPVTLQDSKFNATDTLFYVEKLSPIVKVKPGKLTLTASIYGWQSSLGNTLTTSSYNLPNTGYNIDFRPGLPIQFSRVDSLRFNIGTSNAPQQVHPSLWNFRTETWEKLTLDPLGKVDIREPEQYIGMDGEILLNIQGDPNSYFDITSVDFTMTVQP
jgi:hypothetical protein